MDEKIKEVYEKWKDFDFDGLGADYLVQDFKDYRENDCWQAIKQHVEGD